MEKKVGIWIDSKEAKIVTLTDDQKQFKIIKSEIETRERVAGGSNQTGRFGDQYVDNEKSKEQKIKNQTKAFCKTIIQEISGCDSIVIFGPAMMKHELEKEIKNNSQIAAKPLEVVTADRMTDNQTSAWVVDYFN